MICTSWLDAETIKAMLTNGKSHWMGIPNAELCVERSESELNAGLAGKEDAK